MHRCICLLPFDPIRVRKAKDYRQASLKGPELQPYQHIQCAHPPGRLSVRQNREIHLAVFALTFRPK